MFLQIQYLTCMSVEVHTHTRGSLKPDPDLDPVLAIFYYIHHDWPRPDGSPGENSRLGVIAIDIELSGFTSFVGVPPSKKGATPTKGNVAATPVKGSTMATPTKGNAVTPTKGAAAATSIKGSTDTPTKGSASATPTKPSDIPSSDGTTAGMSSHVLVGSCSHGQSKSHDQSRSHDHDGYLSRCGLPCHVEVKYVSCEHKLLQSLVSLVREEDPDFLIGYEVVMSSWGYLVDRAAALDINLVSQVSRMPSEHFTCVTVWWHVQWNP